MKWVSDRMLHATHPITRGSDSPRLRKALARAVPAHEAASEKARAAVQALRSAGRKPARVHAASEEASRQIAHSSKRNAVRGHLEMELERRGDKTAADLTPAARAKLPGSDFAVKAKKSNTGQEAYPIPDRQHARSALGFAKMHGDSADLAAVRKKIQAKYPDMLKSAQYHSFFTKTAGSLIERMKGLGTELATSAPMQHKAELAGLGVLAAPVGYELQKNVREGHTGDAISNTAELGGLGVLAAPAVAALRHH